MTPPTYPVRLHGYGAVVAIRLPRHIGTGARLYLRQIAKREVGDIYHLPIQTGISGRSDDGQEISINSVGRWVFGTPGYAGHLRASNWEGVTCIVDFPQDSPKEVIALVNRLKAVIEG